MSSEDDVPGRAGLTFGVDDGDTAIALGSGDVPVLATPRLIAWLEAATCAAAHSAGLLPDGRTSVGTRVLVDHLRATPVGARVLVTADLVQSDGRQLRFTVTATDDRGRLVATGEVTRAVVDRARFLDLLR